MRAVIVLTLLFASLAGGAGPAHADGTVSVANDSGAAVIDATYATTLTVRGTGFQSIRGGHGGIYVFFGTVRAGWRPSQGGATGRDYFYVPDSESRDNQGFQRYVAFPGSDTASSANGGTMSAEGSWSTTIAVPGATFRAQDRNGRATTIDCRKVTCGVITVGAHGVVNARNESFTPVRVGDLYGDGESPEAAPEAGDTETPAASDSSTPRGSRKRKPARPALEVDRPSAAAGNVLAFAASGLAAGTQVSAVLDDGDAAAGPFLVGADGRMTGVITIPSNTEAGTHELRLFGVDDPPKVRFAIRAAADGAEPAAAVEDPGNDRAGVVFLAGAALVVLLALGRLLLRRRGDRRAS